MASATSLDTAMDRLTFDDENVDGNHPSSASSQLSLADAKDVRKQVDYYFSDENLVKDKFLLGKMRGRKNRPVPVTIIHTFRKMQHFRPLSAVVNALRNCENVDVLKDGGVWCVKKKRPFILEDVQGPLNAIKAGKSKPSGLEEFYTDGPITPADAEKEAYLFNKSRSISERIETALQRYQSKRKLSNLPKNILDKWLRFGGIDTGPKMFSGGLDSKSLEEYSAADIRNMTATSYIGEDKRLEGYERKWEIAFEDVAMGFLSGQVPLLLDCEEESQVSHCIGVLRSFYNYLIHHDVCPEYNADIFAALKVCDKAELQLLSTNETLRSLPGDFNVACSIIFGGFHKGLYVQSQAWAGDGKDEKSQQNFSELRAIQVFKFGVAQYAAESTFTSQTSKDIKTECTKWRVEKIESNIGLEVCGVEMADAETRKVYQQSPGGIRSLGKLLCRSWTPPDFAEDDLPPGLPQLNNDAPYELYVEDQILALCFPGMKIEASIFTLSSGIKFLDQVTSVRCSFYKALENELVIKYKEPRYITREEQLLRDLKSQNECFDDEG